MTPAKCSRFTHACCMQDLQAAIGNVVRGTAPIPEWVLVHILESMDLVRWRCAHLVHARNTCAADTLQDVFCARCFRALVRLLCRLLVCTSPGRHRQHCHMMTVIHTA